jgi:hypothetical protein
MAIWYQSMIKKTKTNMTGNECNKINLHTTMQHDYVLSTSFFTACGKIKNNTASND